jgi:hypothetical protein
MPQMFSPRIRDCFQPSEPTTESSPGDILWQGDILNGSKSSDATSMLFHNVRDLDILSHVQDLDILSHDQQLLTADIQAISEHQLDTQKLTVINLLQASLPSDFQADLR